MSEVKTNKISSLTSSNSDITLDPDGTGDTVIASGNVGIGTSSPNNLLTLQSSGSTKLNLRHTASGDDYGYIFRTTGATTNDLIVESEVNGTATERMRIDSSGQVMIGTTTAGGQFTVTEGDATTIIDRVGTNVAGIKTGSGDDFCVGTADYTQAIRIKNSTGHVGIGTTDPSSGHLSVETAQNENAVFVHNNASSMTTSSVQVSSSRNTTNGTYRHIQASIHGVADKFRVYDSGNVENSNNSYAGISDQRMKENIVDAASQWDDIKALQVRKFNFIGSELTQIGVVAQELEAVGMDGLITETEWLDVAANPDNEVRKSVKYSVLYMKAIKALQEAMTRIETLETKVAALEAGE